MYIGLHVMYLLFLSDFNPTLPSKQFSKNTQISNFMKLHPVGAQLFHARGWTDTLDEANTCFSQFCKNAEEAQTCACAGRKEPND
jgi:hypothetical protein